MRIEQLKPDSPKRFGVYMAVSVAGFSLIAILLTDYNVSPGWAFAAGFLYSIPVELLRDRMQEVST